MVVRATGPEQGGGMVGWICGICPPMTLCSAGGSPGHMWVLGGCRHGQVGRAAAAGPAGLRVTGGRFDPSRGTPSGPDLASQPHPLPGSFPHHNPLSLQPVGLPHCIYLCHRCMSLCVAGAMQPPGADPCPLQPPIQTCSFKHSLEMTSLIPPTCPLPLAWP